MKPEVFSWLQRVTRWRSLFASWQLGTRSDTDAECNALKDHREATILVIVEQSALAHLLARKGVFTPDEYEAALVAEAQAYNTEMERRFPGFTATESGLTLDVKRAAETMRKYNFPP
jgi:hypothetical protein